ncbi:hypothetical protein BU17DRAFT_51494 [Hysterangium stoloniferum]|nr:hypothetical protein BU17DRAFT_51494 [Hysterangium stoloniferum]
MTSESSSKTHSLSLFYKCQLALGFRQPYAFKLCWWSQHRFPSYTDTNDVPCIIGLFFSSFMALFVFIRLPYLHPPTFEVESSPGEWYWFKQNPYRLGIFLHLFATLPAGFLAIFQFIPAIQLKAVVVHRTIGYIVMILLSLGNIGAIIFSQISMGGNDLPLLASIATLVIATTGSMGLAWYNIKRQQIDEHRKWMLRAMFWMSIIITMRLIQLPVVLAVSYTGGYHTLWTCDQIQSVTGNTTTFYDEFPACHLGMHTLVGVPADVHSLLHVGSAIRLTFAMAVWVAIALHASGVEVYASIHLTSKESERLRMISYYKQKAAGLSPPGSAGITADRWGDSSPWMPPRKLQE